MRSEQGMSKALRTQLASFLPLAGSVEEESQDEEDEDDEDEEEEDEEADGDGEDEDEGDGEEDSDEEGGGCSSRSSTVEPSPSISPEIGSCCSGEKVEEADSEDEARDYGGIFGFSFRSLDVFRCLPKP